MSAQASQQPIIIKKGGHGHHGHHGGAWKVAYADFVTAMMAFFLVMWLVGQSPQVKQSVAGYFRDPVAFEQGGRGVLPGAESGNTGGGQPQAPSTEEQAQQTLERAAEHLKQTLASKFGDIQDRIDIKVTEEGLLIELREAPNDGFFASGSAVAKGETVEVLGSIAEELGQLPNKVAVEGHTDSRPYAATGGSYTNWELSSDRANAARRVLEARGLTQGQVEAVRGYADTRLRLPDEPLDSGNRRISIVVRRELADRPTSAAGSPADPESGDGREPAVTDSPRRQARAVTRVPGTETSDGLREVRDVVGEKPAGR